MKSSTSSARVTKLSGLGLLFTMCMGYGSRAQDLRPRAYLITPGHSNALILGYSFNEGSIFFGTALPITNDSGKYSVPSISYYHTLSLFGRSANFTATLRYVVGNFQGNVSGKEERIHRSGLADSLFRFSVNLHGGPAMSPEDFAKWRQKTILGAGVSLAAPTGQYDPGHLVNPGTNRWAFKAELGLSQRWRNWILDGYAGVWFFASNTNYLTNSQFSQSRNTLAQDPIGAFEVHLSYDVKPRLWFSVDGNYWYGGSTTVDGVFKNGSIQANSRIGVTASIPISKHQPLKFAYSDGTLTRFGGTFKTGSLACQYSWLGRPD